MVCPFLLASTVKVFWAVVVMKFAPVMMARITTVPEVLPVVTELPLTEAGPETML